MRRVFCRCALLLVIAISSAPVRSADKAICMFTAFAAPAQLSGTPIRSAPHPDAEVLGLLPTHGRDEMFAPEFNVIGSQEGWFEITAAAVGQYGTEPMRILFHGPGWIPASEVDFRIGDGRIFDRPYGRVLGTLAGGGILGDLQQVEVHGCQGLHVDIEVVLPEGDQIRGWVRDACANQFDGCF